MPNIEVLRQIPLFTQLPEEHLQWLAEEGTEVSLDAGTKIAEQGDSPDGFYAILEGQTEWMQRVGDRQAHAITLGPGEIFAELLLILDEPYPVTGQALTMVRLYKLEPKTFWDLLYRCRAVMRDIVRVAAERSQMHESVTQQQAKLISLGTMAAGLAHEMNNPAAAVQRSSQELYQVFQHLSQQAFRLNHWTLSPEQRQFIDELPVAVMERAKEAPKLDPLVQSDREDEMSDWLEERGVKESWKLVPLFVEAGLNTDWLVEVSQHVPEKALGDILSWLESAISGKRLLQDIQQGSARLSDLVQAIKHYSHMDKAQLQKIDVRDGIEDTLTILGYKLRKARIEVYREFDPEVPQIWVYGGELNQVWTNLIDNAIDALQDGEDGAPASPKIWIRTREESDRVVVEIADNGPGIPQKVQLRIFEPFFTTKKVGQGTGLGLDICKRIVEGQHKGNLRFESKPGETRFEVRLPREGLLST